MNSNENANALAPLTNFPKSDELRGRLYYDTPNLTPAVTQRLAITLAGEDDDIPINHCRWPDDYTRSEQLKLLAESNAITSEELSRRAEQLASFFANASSLMVESDVVTRRGRQRTEEFESYLNNAFGFRPPAIEDCRFMEVGFLRDHEPRQVLEHSQAYWSAATAYLYSEFASSLVAAQQKRLFGRVDMGCDGLGRYSFTSFQHHETTTQRRGKKVSSEMQRTLTLCERHLVDAQSKQLSAMTDDELNDVPQPIAELIKECPKSLRRCLRVLDGFEMCRCGTTFDNTEHYYETRMLRSNLDPALVLDVLGHEFVVAAWE